MKCDELKAEQWLDYSGEPMPCYPKVKVDAAFAELKAENERLKKCEIWMMQHFYCEEVIACESAKNRRLKRALWLARGYIMTLLQRDFQRLAYQCNSDDYKTNLLHRRNRYYDLSEKFLKKADEYK